MEKENALQKTEIKPSSFSNETIETVKRSIFRGASDDELKLFIHKCLTVGVHPLDKLITPIKFNTRDGPVVSFITSIDLMRSKAEETELYDGQDEPVYEYGDDDDKRPTKATVNIYKKGIGRPFVGVAYWTEFYPDNEKKRQLWDKMPHIMIAKCAEGQGLRKGFPQKLNKLYAEEEMHQAITRASGSVSTKPEITQETTEKENVTSKSGTERQVPTQGETDSLRLISEKQGYLLIAKLKENGVSEQSLLNYLKIPSVFYVTWNKKVNTCMDKLLKTIQDKPKFFDKYKAPESEKKEEPSPDQKAPTVQGDEDFIKNLRTIAFAAGCKDDEAINKKLLVNFPKIESMDKIDANSQGLVIDFFISLKDNPEQA